MVENRPAVAFTIAYGRHAVAAARLLRATFAAAHPDIPFLLVEDGVYSLFARQKAVAHVAEIVSLRTMIGYFLSLHFPRVIYLDADVLVLDRLERLLDWDAPAEAVFTRDVAAFDYGFGPDVPVLNAGVLAASSPRFWRTWMTMVYSCVVPVAGNFFDQFALRLLARNGAVPTLVLPEEAERDFYNIGYRDHPGDWAIAGGPADPHVRKGDARVRLWHWAGDTSKVSLDMLPEPVRRAALARIEQGKGHTNYADENRLLRLLFDAHGEPFQRMIEAEFAALGTLVMDGITFRNRVAPPGLFSSEAPAAWDALRPPLPGLHRRLLARAPRYLYARDPERLLQPDVEALDVPGLSG